MVELYNDFLKQRGLISSLSYWIAVGNKKPHKKSEKLTYQPLNQTSYRRQDRCLLDA